MSKVCYNSFFPNIFEKQGSTDIWWGLSTTALSPFVNDGATLGILTLSGKMLFSIDKLYINKLH